MKTTSLLRWMMPVACAAAVVLLPGMAFAAPKVDIHEALKIADGVLERKGVAGQTTIVSMALQPTALLGGETVWYVEWDASIPSQKEGKKTIGIEIHMDGSVVHVVNGHGKKKHVSPH